MDNKMFKEVTTMPSWFCKEFQSAWESKDKKEIIALNKAWRSFLDQYGIHLK